VLIDCDQCVMRDIACGDCVVTMLLGPVGDTPSWDESEAAALAALAEAGLVSPLRLTVIPGGQRQAG
jgi:hypothetical protein